MIQDIEKATIQIPPQEAFVEPTVSFALSFANRLGITSVKQDILQKAFRESLKMVIDRHLQGNSSESLNVEFSQDQDRLVTSVHNRGLPMFLDQDDVQITRFHEANRGVDNISVENLGRNGQIVRLFLNLSLKDRLKRSNDSQIQTKLEVAAEDIQIRQLRADEADDLSRLFYFVYGYNYINDYVYYPEKLKAMIESGQLISTVAVLPNGRLIGHVGLFRWNETPKVYEACLGVVDPMVKSRGVFRNLFKETMNQVNSTSMQYCFFDFVTNHDFSQREVCSYGTCETALLVGCQTRTTQASLEKLGLGTDSASMDRYSLLYSLYPRVKYPFGREVFLPQHLGELLGYVLKPLNINWSPTPRFDVLSPEGKFTSKYQPAQNSVLFDFVEPGRHALNQILKEWEELLRTGYKYAGVDVPLNFPGLGQVSDVLSSRGFSVGGFLPYHYSDQLSIRFQAIGPTRVAFDDIRVSSAMAKRLLTTVREDYEQNKLL